MPTESEIEQEIKDKGLTAPRLTPEKIDNTILTEQYYVFPGTCLTVCAMTLRNGFNTVGHSACADPTNFDDEIGKKLAREDARKRIWVLEGYLLKESLYQKQKDISNA